MVKISKKNRLVAAILTASMGLSLLGAFPARTLATQAEEDHFAEVNIALSNDVAVNVGITAPEGYTTATMDFTCEGETVSETADVSSGEAVLSSTLVDYLHLDKALEMQLTLSGDGQEDIVQTKSDFTVQGYLNNLLSKSYAQLNQSAESNRAMANLIVDLLRLSDEAKSYLNMEGDRLTDGLAETMANVITDYSTVAPTGSDLAFVGEKDDNLAWKGGTLHYEHNVSMAVEFGVKNLANEPVVQVERNGDSCELECSAVGTVGEYTVYRAVYPISVAHYADVCTFSVLDGTTTVGQQVNYSVRSYAYNMQDNEKGGALAQATYAYGVSAKAYADAVGVDGSVLPLDYIANDNFKRSEANVNPDDETYVSAYALSMQENSYLKMPCTSTRYCDWILPTPVTEDFTLSADFMYESALTTNTDLLKPLYRTVDSGSTTASALALVNVKTSGGGLYTANSNGTTLNASLKPGVWTNVAVSYHFDSNSRDIYINGELVLTEGVSATMQGNEIWKVRLLQNKKAAEDSDICMDNFKFYLGDYRPSVRYSINDTFHRATAKLSDSTYKISSSTGLPIELPDQAYWDCVGASGMPYVDYQLASFTNEIFTVSMDCMVGEVCPTNCDLLKAMPATNATTGGININNFELFTANGGQKLPFRLQPNEWVNIAIVFDTVQQIRSFYVNGVYMGFATNTNDFTDVEMTRIRLVQFKKVNTDAHLYLDNFKCYYGDFCIDA